ncbi:5-hydroxytryptamine receptor [Fasciola hepatica]|uniref:5-hydroxytryptamine receptor n=1 Tax=Fasciola hepatica TaxID=6192 RepID=A0A2H1CKJ3_FASHE|nr:5-hydroxytryptamine receptor [Fasciola hepatica]
MDVLCCTASILHLVAIAIDRYWAITKLSYVRTRTTKPVLIMIAVVWVTALAISLPTRFHHSRNDYLVLVDGQCQINDDYAFTIISTVGAFYLPMAFLIGVYAKIYQAAQKRIRKRRFRTSKMSASPYGLQKTNVQSNGTIIQQSEKSFSESLNLQMTKLKTKLGTVTHLKTAIWKQKPMNYEFNGISFGTDFADHAEETSEHDISITFNDDLSSNSKDSSSFCSSSNQKSLASGASICCYETQITSTRTPISLTIVSQECHAPISCLPKYRPTLLFEKNHSVEPQTSVLGPVFTHSPTAQHQKRESAFFPSNDPCFSCDEPTEGHETIQQPTGLYLPNNNRIEEDIVSNYSTLTVEQDSEHEIIPCSVSNSDFSIALKQTAFSDSETDTVSVPRPNDESHPYNCSNKMPPKLSTSVYQKEIVTSPVVVEFSLCSNSGSGSTLQKSMLSTQSVSPPNSGFSLADRGNGFPNSPFLCSGQSTPSGKSLDTTPSVTNESEYTGSSSGSELAEPFTTTWKLKYDLEKGNESSFQRLQQSESKLMSTLVQNGPTVSRYMFYPEKQNTFVISSLHDSLCSKLPMTVPLINVTPMEKPWLDSTCVTMQSEQLMTNNETVARLLPAVINKNTISPEKRVVKMDMAKLSSQFTTINSDRPADNHTAYKFSENHTEKPHELLSSHLSSASPLPSNAILEAEHHRERVESRRERKAARTLAIITGCFILCWFPFFARALYAPFCMPTCSLPSWVESFLLWLGYLNSLLNPILYTVFSPDFRNAFKKIVCGRLSIRTN